MIWGLGVLRVLPGVGVGWRGLAGVPGCGVGAGAGGANAWGLVRVLGESRLPWGVRGVRRCLGVVWRLPRCGAGYWV